MLSISETINDMEAYTQLTDHVYYRILHSTDPALEEVSKCNRSNQQLSVLCSTVTEKERKVQ